MQTIAGNIYDYPKYYDLIFGSDWKAEFEFLEACFEKYVPRGVEKVFEPACGTGRLIYRLAKAGYQVSGLDINPKAIAYCQQRFQKGGLEGDVFVGDMTDFRLSRKVDAAFNTINSFRHLDSEKLAVAHLQCMADALRKGGIYLLGFHLTPLVGPATEEESWTARRGHLQVNTHMWLLERNLKKRQELYGMRFDIYTPSESYRIEDRILFRTYTWKQLLKLVDAVEGLQLADVYDFAYDASSPIELQDDTEDVVLVLQKQ